MNGNPTEPFQQALDSLLSPGGAMVCLVELLMFAVLVLFIVDLAINRRWLRGMWAYGFMPAGVALGLDVVVWVLVPEVADEPLAAVVRLLTMVIAFGQLFLFASVGIASCRSIHHPSIPLIRRATRHWLPLRPIDGWAYVLSLGLVTACGVALSAGLFHLTAPRVSDFVRAIVRIEGPAAEALERHPVALSLMMVRIAIAEEVVFRLGLQSWLARHLKLRGGRYWIAIAISTGLWTAAHALSLEPMWVKFAQILPFGLALGWLFRKYGLEICILAHAAFNIVLVNIPLNVVE